MATAWETNSDSNEIHTVLIISRDMEMVGVWETLYTQKNCRVISETSAEYGLQAARLLSPALIVLNLDLPDGEILTLCRDLRSTSNGTLLLLAPKYNNRDISEYYYAGVDEYILSPISPMALLIKSMAWLARQDWIVPRKQNVQMYS